MSAVTSQVIEQISTLPPHDLKAVAAAVRARRVQANRDTSVHGGVRDGFERIVEKVFTTHEELLSKLAQ